MTSDDAVKYCKGFATPETRWSRFGSYYAMFPVDFAFDVVSEYSKPGDKVLDPFCGRGTSLFAASALGRMAHGIDINPLGYLYSSVKLAPADKDDVLARLEEIYDLRHSYTDEAAQYDEYFKMCYCHEVLYFLLAARDNLKWKEDEVDRTLAAFVALHLHDKIGAGLSNQMRMTKSLSKQYSINWWKAHNLSTPPEINPYKMLADKIERRYAKGKPRCRSGEVSLGDSCSLTQKMIEQSDNGYALLFTSPPYCGITDYFLDQWLRLWLLGGSPCPSTSKDTHKARFVNKDEYALLLDTVFDNCAALMRKDCKVYVRTDSREFTLEATLDALRKSFPYHHIEVKEKPVADNVKTQTQVCGNRSNKRGEVDIVLTNMA